MTLEAQAAALGGLEQHHYAGMATLRHALRRFLAFSDERVKAHNTTAPQYQAMLVIAAHPVGEIRPADLADEMLMSQGAAAQLAERMEEAGLIERRRSPDEAMVLAPTGEGEALLEVLAADHLRELMKVEPLVASSLRLLRRATS